MVKKGASKIKRAVLWLGIFVVGVLMVPAVILLIGALPQALIYVPIRFALGDYEADRSWRGWVLDWPRKWLHLGKVLLIRLAIGKEPSPFGEGFGKGLGGMLGGSSDWADLLRRVIGDVFPKFYGLLLVFYLLCIKFLCQCRCCL